MITRTLTIKTPLGFVYVDRLEPSDLSACVFRVWADWKPEHAYFTDDREDAHSTAGALALVAESSGV